MISIFDMRQYQQYETECAQRVKVGNEVMTIITNENSKLLSTNITYGKIKISVSFEVQSSKAYLYIAIEKIGYVKVIRSNKNVRPDKTSIIPSEKMEDWFYDSQVSHFINCILDPNYNWDGLLQDIDNSYCSKHYLNGTIRQFTYCLFE